MRGHPNATAAAATSVLAVVVIWILGMFGIPMPEEVAAGVAGVLTTVVLLIGRHGIKGLAGLVWSGSDEEPDEGKGVG